MYSNVWNFEQYLPDVSYIPYQSLMLIDQISAETTPLKYNPIIALKNTN